MKNKVETHYEEQRRKGLELKKLHDAEMEEYGEPHPITGKRMERPKSTGTMYNIPPADGTYCPHQVDVEGKDCVDINKLMAKHDPSGELFKKAISQGLTTDGGMTYDNFIDGPTFQEAQNNYIHGKQQFELLPAAIRNKFENDPVRFMDFVHDEKTLEEQYKMGIRIKPPVKQTDMSIKELADVIKTTSKPKKPPVKGADTDEE